jgi:NAD(P)-dependent dehydrogenase (short-subunit alcohol dehydrogenase family)
MSEQVRTQISKRRVALITGGSRGIGRAIVMALARTGYNCMLSFVANEAAAEEARNEAETAGQTKVRSCRSDIANGADRARLLSATKHEFGRLDLLVNNAGVAPNKRVDLLEAGEESFDRLLAVNLKGPYFLSQLAARWMIEQKASNLPDYTPAIVNITSISAYAASPDRGEYCVSKAGLSMMNKLFAARLADEGINVFEIRPGVIATDMTAGVTEKYDRLIDQGLTPIKRWGTPEDVGFAVAAVASGSFPFSTGEVINVDGGFHLRRL